MARVLTKIRREECRILLIAPDLPQATWYQALKELCVEVPIKLPGVTSLVVQSHTRVLRGRLALVWIRLDIVQ